MLVAKRNRGPVSVLLVGAMAAALALTVTGTAAAAGTVLFDQTFKDNTAGGTGAVVLPATASGAANAACLTATGNTTTGVLKSCPTSTVAAPTVNDPPGTGALSLTPLQKTVAGGVFAATSVPTSQGLDVTFDLNQYGGGTYGADGIAFALAAVNPTSPTAPPNIGQTGGALGYSSQNGTVKGLANAYLGVGFDVFGNFSNTQYQGGGCPASTLVTKTKVPGQVLVRGPGNLTVGYCPLAGTGTNANTTTPPVVPMHAATRSAAKVPVEIAVNSSAAPVTTPSNLTVAAESFLVAFTPIGGGQRTLTGALPVMAASMVGAPSWLDSDGLPKQLAFGWVGSTGSVLDNHEVSNAKVSSLSAVAAQLTVGQVNYTPAAADTTTALPTGSPIGYVVTPGVAAGANETGTISVTETVPAGMKPLAASGTGWVCGNPSGQAITCSNSGGPFPAGGTLPAVTVTAVVTGNGVSQSTVQTASVVTASSDTGLAGYSTTSSTAANPTAPVVTTLSPATGPAAGGTAVTISGTDLTGATSIQIGTDPEIAAGTATTLFPCPGGVAAPGCFTVSGATLVISSMLPHAGGPVTVRVVNLGATGSSTYTYTSVPGAPVVTATAGITSATVSWTAPSNGGSPITGYTVTPYLGGVLQTSLVQHPAAGVTSATFTGLTAGGSYTFRVAATNSIGTGATGTSAAVVPYTTPGAARSPTATASTGQAVVSWLAPLNNGSSTITGYVVTPYLAGVAQTPQSFASAALTQTVTGLTAGSSYTFTVKAVNAAGAGLESAPTAAVTINAAPTLALPTPVPGEVGAAYSSPAFTATGGTAPLVWTVTSGALPNGVALSSAGVLSGTPTAAGTAAFTVTVTDAAGTTANQALTLTVVPAPVLANPAAPAGQVGVGYSDQLTVQTGTGTAPFAWSISAGSLPGGVTLNAATGLLSGAPTAAGSFPFTVQVTDARAQTATQNLTIAVTPSPSLSFPAPPGGQVGVPYSDPLVVTGGTAPFTWSSTGTLPAGLTLNPSTGLLSGTPTAAGTFPVTIRVQDSTGQSATKAVILSIAASPTLTFPPPAGEVGAPYTAQPVLTGGTGPVGYSISAGTLPAGLTINTATGAITGTPTAVVSATVTIRVVDAFGQSATAAGTIVVAAAPSLALPVPPTGEVGQPYSNQLTVTGGTGPFTWSIPTGTLPAGLSLAATTGLISGTPTAAGSATVTVKVTDAFGQNASQDITLVIRAASTVSLDTSVTSTAPGGTVALTATVGPDAPTGAVTFSDTITSGPLSGSTAILGTAPVAPDGTARITTTLTAFGAHGIAATYTGDAGHGSSTSPTHTVQVVATAGTLIVTEFRLSGPAGAGDQYVELTNVSPNPLALPGFQIAASSGAVTTLPADSPVLPTGRSYLVGGPAFSLAATAHPDDPAGADLGAGGIAILAPDTTKTTTDAVGPDDPGYHLGTPLPAFTGAPADQYAWVRTQATGYFKNTQNNAADFALVSTTGGLVGGVQSMLGSASPTGSTDPWQHTFVVTSKLADPATAANLNPNRIVVKITPGQPGSLQVRRTLTNTTTDTVTSMKLRIVTISEANGLSAPASAGTGPKAQLRATDPATPTSTITVAGAPVTVQNLSVDPPVSADPGGGLNTTLTAPLPPGGLPPGASLTVGLTFATDVAGTFWFAYDVDTLGLT